MRLFATLLSLGLVFAACKKNPQVVAHAASEVAKATPAASATPIPEPINLKSQVIVLCYHRFEDKPKDSLAIKPADFEAQMQALKDSGITVIPMTDFLAWRRGEKEIPEKAAIVSIDDGYLSGYKGDQNLEDNPSVGINSPRCATREWTLRATLFPTAR
jgi:hypothetical protein